ncbi:hypothetical protein D3C79_996310 [compost metagenome]
MMPQTRFSPNSCTPRAPVTIGSGAMLPPNQRVNRSLTFPWRSCGGTYPIVCFSISGADVAVVMTNSKARMSTWTYFDRAGTKGAFL